MSFISEVEEMTGMNKVDWKNLGFGKYFSDHVYISEFKDGYWDGGKITKFADMNITPAMCTLHYGQTIFEGLKAYRDFTNGGFNIFRPEMNAKRLNNSARQLCIPEFPEDKFLNAIKDLSKTDEQWIPQNYGESLYIRPVVYGDGDFLGVHSSDTYKLIIMTSPVGSYYASGLKPVKILVSKKYVRATRGGLGTAKTAANYAASLYAGQEAKKLGFSQVLWLDGVEREYVDEVGAMNIFFVINDTLVTPTLEQGSILAGVTRDTVLKLAKQWDMKIEERKIKITEVFDRHRKGELTEVFGTGTAAVISPVGMLKLEDEEIIINNDEIGPYAQKFYNTITGIMHGSLEDVNNWNTHIE